MDGTRCAEAVETLLHTCSRGGDREDVARLLLLQQIATGRVSDVDEAVEEVDGASVIDEVFSLGKAHGIAPPRTIPPSPSTIGAKELWEAFPSWCRDTALGRRRCGDDSLSRRSFVCGAWNSGGVAGDLRFRSTCRRTTVYRSPWFRRYQLPLGTLGNDADANNHSDSNGKTDAARTAHSLEEEANAIEEAQNEGRLTETWNYGNMGVIITEFEQRLNQRLEKYGTQYFYTPGDSACTETESLLSCPWATSAFVRNSSSAEDVRSGIVTLEVVVLTCVDTAEEQPLRAAASLFDGYEVFGEDEWLYFPETSANSYSKRRWSAGHSFQLRVGPTELQIRHDSAYLIANCKHPCDRGVGDVVNGRSRIWLFYKSHRRPETSPVPRQRCRKDDLATASSKGGAPGDALLETLDLDAIVTLLCASVETSDNAVVSLAVTPVVRVTLPLVAPSPGRVWEKSLQEGSALVAAAGMDVAAMVCNQGGRS
ncbi:hypothetical protein TraAM80_00815 [Trypanosoma rangeli]|uniref:Uncharacterized protein n=1 Tax=Trypanosoma rangeli TaxID=5698 RepID=A0A3R7KQI1_TRYRA|nr:uncharacterized protein TraAM80_00815 [Trypanosoma rangeli]RNF11622.1 hypothetical protein TraAM80_00815 [Trypanosoma rangeli]|eukprot:RNF11622.1 hypothetical protein TraAM80_00815 [Trypanosoma rangeli]